VRVQRANRRVKFTELAALFVIQWMALAAWTVPLTLILNAHGYQNIQPYAFATSAVAAFVSPLFFGAVADRHVSPVRVLRWLSLGTAAAMAMTSAAVQSTWSAWIVLSIIQIYALCAAPTTSISTAIVLSTMDEPRRQYGPIRAMGTIGWMGGCWLVSVLNADASVLAGYSSAALWLGLATFTLLLPDVEPPPSAEHLTWHERLGLDALTLLKNLDHRVVFLTTGLLSIPLAAFYPYTPLHLSHLGMQHPAGWMSLAQTTEIVAMFGLGALLLRWRLKWILLAGICFGFLRYVLFAMDEKLMLLAGIVLHGLTYTLFFTTAQIYINDRVDAGWRTRAQALLTLMNNGVGYLIGYLGCGIWFNACTRSGQTRWQLFWAVLALALAAVVVYFLVAYHGIGRGIRPAKVVFAESKEESGNEGTLR
jgi:nucleoside transporter